MGIELKITYIICSIIKNGHWNSILYENSSITIN